MVKPYSPVINVVKLLDLCKKQKNVSGLILCLFNFCLFQIWSLDFYTLKSLHITFKFVNIQEPNAILSWFHKVLRRLVVYWVCFSVDLKSVCDSDDNTKTKCVVKVGVMEMKSGF